MTKLEKHGYDYAMQCMKAGRDGLAFPFRPLSSEKLDAAISLYDKYRRQWLKWNK